MLMKETLQKPLNLLREVNGTFPTAASWTRTLWCVHNSRSSRVGEIVSTYSWTSDKLDLFFFFLECATVFVFTVVGLSDVAFELYSGLYCSSYCSWARHGVREPYCLRAILFVMLFASHTVCGLYCSSCCSRTIMFVTLFADYTVVRWRVAKLETWEGKKVCIENNY